MKKTIALLCAAALLLCMAACKKEASEAAEPDGARTEAAETAAPQEEALRLRIVDGEGSDTFTLAGEGASDVYTAVAGELTVYLNGKPAAPADLENGMTVTVEPGYELLETWPAQFAGATVRAEKQGKAGYGDLCGLYLTVLSDLWDNDAALNSGITYISVDLSEAPGALTDGEKAAVAWLFAGRHGAQALTYGFAQLKEYGYVDDAELYWKDGLLFRIGASENAKQSEKKLVFDAEKWRSGTGAIFFNDCTAARGKGAAWEYKPGGFAIA